MSNLSQFEITKRWPAKKTLMPFNCILYPRPNGMKISAMLEEIGVDYEAHLVNFGADEQHSPRI